MAEHITITFARTRTIEETVTVTVAPERLRELVAEHASQHDDDIVGGFGTWNVDDMAPVLAAIEAETGALPTESKTSDSIDREPEHNIDDFFCGDHAVSEHCATCGECPDDDHACEDCGECPDECTCEETDDEDEEEEDDDA